MINTFIKRKERNFKRKGVEFQIENLAIFLVVMQTKNVFTGITPQVKVWNII